MISTTPGQSRLKRDMPDRKPDCGVTCTEAYFSLSGTSMSTASVSGAAILMLDQDPSLSPSTIKARLMRSARKINADPVTGGAGVLDVNAALAETGVMYGQALSPLMRRVPEAPDAIFVEPVSDHIRRAGTVAQDVISTDLFRASGGVCEG